MFDMNDFLKAVKKTAVEAVNASKPANMVFGKVISASPLKIKVDQKLILTTAQLVLSRNVTNYRLSVTVDWETETNKATTENTETTETETEHTHEVKGDKFITVRNALTVGEEVILMQVSGGQKYIVIDRIGKG